jgi:hypothetical protein
VELELAKLYISSKKYMSMYGIDNVRGGSYVEIVLNNNIVKLLEN